MQDFIAKNWFSIIALFLNAGIFAVLKFNDLKHLSNDFKEFKEAVWKRVDRHGEEITKCGKGIARIEGRLGIHIVTEPEE